MYWPSLLFILLFAFHTCYVSASGGAQCAVEDGERKIGNVSSALDDCIQYTTNAEGRKIDNVPSASRAKPGIHSKAIPRGVIPFIDEHSIKETINNIVQVSRLNREVFRPCTLLMDREILFPATRVTDAQIIFNEPSTVVFEARLINLIRLIDDGQMFQDLLHLTIIPGFIFLEDENPDLVVYYLRHASALVNRIRHLKTVTINYTQRVLFMEIEPTAPLGQNVFPIARDGCQFSTRIKSLYANGWSWNIDIPKLPHLKRIRFISKRLYRFFDLRIMVSEHMEDIILDCPDATISLSSDGEIPRLQQFSVNGDWRFVDDDTIYAISRSDALQILSLRGLLNPFPIELQPEDVHHLTKLSKIHVTNVIFNFPNTEPTFPNLLTLERGDGNSYEHFDFTNVHGDERDAIAFLVLSGRPHNAFTSSALVAMSSAIQNVDEMDRALGMANASNSLQELTLRLFDVPEATVDLSNSNINALHMSGMLRSRPRVNIATTHRLKSLTLTWGTFPTLPETENLYLTDVTIPSFRSLQRAVSLTLVGVQIESFDENDCEHMKLCGLMHTAFLACSELLPDKNFEHACFTTLTDILSINKLLYSRLAHVVSNVASVMIWTEEGEQTKIDVEDHVQAIVIHSLGMSRQMRYRIFVENTRHISVQPPILYPRGRMGQIKAKIREFLVK